MEFRSTGLPVGKYEVGQTIGSGTSAKVKLGRDVSTGQLVALKAFRKNQDGKYKKVAKYEVDALRAARHPSVIKVLDIVITDRKLYLVLEYADGGDLLSLLSGGQLSEAEVRTYFYQVITAVNHCHSRGVSHRDLKPENILLDREGNVKLADFGLATLRGPMQQGIVFGRVGTYGYMAPEAFQSVGYDSEPADLWSCGVILFFMLTDRLPFDRHDPNFVIKIAAADYDMPRRFSSGVRDLVRRLLEPEPRTRISGSQVLQHAWLREGPNINRPVHAGLAASVSDNPTEESDLDARLDAIFDSIVDPIATELQPVQAQGEPLQVTAVTSADGSPIHNLIRCVPHDSTSKKVFLTRRFSVQQLLETLERSARECDINLKVMWVDETIYMETRRPWYQWCIAPGGYVSATADVIEVRSGISAVLLHKTGGNNSLRSLRCWQQLCTHLLADVV